MSTPFFDPKRPYTVRSRRLDAFSLPSPPAIGGEGYVYQHAQGGCLIGDTLYTCMITDGSVQPPRCCIVKHDIRDGKLLGFAGEYRLGHANDATYDPESGMIAVSLCDGSTGMGLIDSKTMELTEIKEPEGKILCNIHYDPVSKIYVACGCQNQMIYVYDRAFKLLKQFPGRMSRDEYGEYSMQGVITDGVYAYVLEWHGGHRWPSENITIEKEVHSHFLVYDLASGEYVTTVELGILREVEYACYRDGRFYFGTNNIHWNGMEVYELTVEQED